MNWFRICEHRASHVTSIVMVINYQFYFPQVVVEYGADLHTFDHGSGFPTRRNTNDPDDEVIL